MSQIPNLQNPEMSSVSSVESFSFVAGSVKGEFQNGE